MLKRHARPDPAAEVLQQQSELLVHGAGLVLAGANGNAVLLHQKRSEIPALTAKALAFVRRLTAHLETHLLTPLDHEDLLRIGLQMSSMLKTISVVAEMMEEQGSALPKPAKTLWAAFYDAHQRLPGLISGVLARKPERSAFATFQRDLSQCRHDLAEARAAEFASDGPPIPVIRRMDLFRVLERLLNESRELGRELQRVHLKNG